MVNKKKTNAKKTNRWCCVPECNYEENKGSLHIFPSKDKALRKKWAIQCKIKKKITANMFVCSNHFRKEDYIPKFKVIRPRLKYTAFPTLNLPKRNVHKILTLEEEEEICSEEESSTDKCREDDKSEEDRYIPLSDSSVKCENCQIHNNLSYRHNKVTVYEAVLELRRKLTCLLKHTPFTNPFEVLITEEASGKYEKFNFMDFMKSDEDLILFTGINYDMLGNLISMIGACEQNPNQYEIDVESRIALSLCMLKLNLTFESLAVFFGITRETCGYLFIITIHSLAYALANVINWPSKEEIVQSMPESFSNFKNTHVILHRLEVPVECPKCQRCQRRLHSDAKNQEVVKVLVAVAPNGLIMYCSKPYGGYAPDGAMFVQSNIVKKLQPEDAIMVDKGFCIEEECAAADINLIVPPDLGAEKPPSSDDILLTIKISSARIHVERIIQKMKLFNILKSKVALKIAPYMGEIVTVICGIINLSESALENKSLSIRS